RDDPGRFHCRGASVEPGLYLGCGLEPPCGGEGLVCQDQIPALVPHAFGRSGAGLPAAAALCRSRFLSFSLGRVGAARPHTPRSILAKMKELLRAQALAEGFSSMGVCRPDAVPEAAGRLRAFLAEGRHGEMAWMADREEWRGSAAALWPEARSVVMLAEVYTPEEDPTAVLERPELGAVSCYAQGKDYHDLVKRRLKRVGRWLLDEAKRQGLGGA